VTLGARAGEIEGAGDGRMSETGVAQADPKSHVDRDAIMSRVSCRGRPLPPVALATPVSSGSWLAERTTQPPPAPRGPTFLPAVGLHVGTNVLDQRLEVVHLGRAGGREPRLSISAGSRQLGDTSGQARPGRS